MNWNVAKIAKMEFLRKALFDSFDRGFNVNVVIQAAMFTDIIGMHSKQ